MSAGFVSFSDTCYTYIVWSPKLAVLRSQSGVRPVVQDSKGALWVQDARLNCKAQDSKRSKDERYYVWHRWLARPDWG